MLFVNKILLLLLDLLTYKLLGSAYHFPVLAWKGLASTEGMLTWHVLAMARPSVVR